MRKSYESQSRELASKIQAVQDYSIELKQIQNLHEVTIENSSKLRTWPNRFAALRQGLTLASGDGEGQFYGPNACLI